MAATEKIITPYKNIPYLPLENADQTSRHGAQFFSNVKQLQVGFGSQVFRVDRAGMWAGAEAFADAPWSVDWDGNMIANSITLSGYVPTGGAAADVNAGATTVSGGKLTAGTVTADKINVSSLSAISANIGTITAGSLSAVTISGATVTGTTLTTATSGQRVVLTSTLAQFYNSSGTLIVETYAASNSYLIAGAQSTSSIILDAGSSGGVLLRNNGTSIILVDGGGMYPWSNATYDLGGAGVNWYDFYLYHEFNYFGIVQPRLYHGSVSGNTVSGENSGFSASSNNSSTGIYTITHNLGTTDYTVMVTPQASAVKNITISAKSSNSFTVRIANLSNALENNDFMFHIFLNP